MSSVSYRFFCLWMFVRMGIDLKCPQVMSHFVSVEVVLSLSGVGDQLKYLIKCGDQEQVPLNWISL